MAQNNGLKDVGKGLAELGKASAGALATGAGMIGSLGRTGGGAANGVLGFTGRLLSGAAQTIQKHPKMALLLGVYGGVKGVQHIVRKSKEKQAQAAEAAAVASAAEQYAPQPVNAYSDAAMQQSSPEQQQQEALLRELMQAQAAQAEAPSTQWQQKIENERSQAKGPAGPSF